LEHESVAEPRRGTITARAIISCVRMARPSKRSSSPVWVGGATSPIDYEALSRELARALRGQRSQVAFCRRIELGALDRTTWRPADADGSVVRAAPPRSRSYD
jgi:hypothetical protein